MTVTKGNIRSHNTAAAWPVVEAAHFAPSYSFLPKGKRFGARFAKMVKVKTILVDIILLLVLCRVIRAQDDSDKINSNIGGAASFPVNPTSKFVKTSWGLVGGAGYNFSRHHSIIGEFMWSALYPSDSSLQPIRVALNDNTITGHSNLYALTGNYRYQWQGRRIGAYFIGGGGWYYRTLGFTKSVTSGNGIACTPAWVWWGFACDSGLVIANQTLGGYDSSVFGGNIGAGLTVKIGDSTYRIYIEPRYHYAPTKNVNTELVVITVGIRY